MFRFFILLSVLSLPGSPFVPVFAGSGKPDSIPISKAMDFSSSDLPIIVIDTEGKRIRDNPRTVVHMGAIDNGRGKRNQLSDSYNDYDGRIAIELRGSATGGYPKQQYRFETQDDAGENLNVRLLGLPTENDWILYGPYDDQSLIRNVLAFKLSNDMGRYASRTRFCEVVVDGDYRGLYVLMEKLKRDNDRIDISPMDSEDVAGDSLTGGYIIKIDKIEGENVGGWRSDLGTDYQYHYPKADEIVARQEKYIRDFMDEFENAMNRNDISDPDRGYPRYIDIDSFVDHFILSEAPKNVDAYRISAYMYKDRDSKGGLLVMGPIWDYNLSFGKAWYEEDLFLTEGWQVNYNIHRPWDGFHVPFWWENLSRDSAFVERVLARWQDLRKGLLKEENLFATIDQLTDSIAEARIRNFERWPETARDHSYEQEIQIMKEWIVKRFDWMDDNIDKLTPVNHGETHDPTGYVLEQNYPNPFNAGTQIGFYLKKEGSVKIEIYNVRGEKVHTLIDGQRPAGHHVIRFDGKDLPSGVFLYRIQSDGFSDVKKMTLLR